MTKREQESGAVLVTVLMASVILATLASFMLTTTSAVSRLQLTEEGTLQLRYLAESGMRHALVDLRAGGDGNLGSKAAPVVFGPGGYYTTTVDNGDQTFTAVAVGITERGRKAIRAVIRRTGGAFANAIFAGNSSGDPNYTLEFGGTGSSADQIRGDIYSGGDIEVSGEATLTGQLSASGTITGASGTEGALQSSPDIASMNYEVNHDFDVAQEFTSHSTYKYDNAGGYAFQLPEENPAHIFRMNPSDRSTETSSTVKNDYFLEDPYEYVGVDKNWDGTDCFELTLSGTGSEPGPDSNSKVFFIDGNMWIHNFPTYSFKFMSPDGKPIRVTFVVKGNIYIGDNLFYQDMNRDGIALIAIKDSAVADSGNIYFGDPNAGTLETMHSYMYAENNFYDNNLGRSGSKNIVLYGTMSAGNQVDIQRDFETQYSRFELNFDDRLMNGQVTLPNLPQSHGEVKYAIVAWQEASH